MSENKEHYRFFQNRECEYFPCHQGIDPEDINCLFCYCPLYALGKRCGGKFEYSPKGIKMCTDCVFPHRAENYPLIIERYREIADVVRREDAWHEREAGDK